jgi:glycosyltransferase involved in cell wall biosynthesis
VPEPKVTVVMSVRNCQSTIEAALKSVIRQTFCDWDLIVVDDGSTDSTPALLRSFDDRRIRIILEPDSKDVGTRANQAVAMATGRYIARMDGDDICYPYRFQKEVEFLDAHPEVDLVASSIVVIDANAKPIGFRPVPSVHEQICAKAWARFPMAQPSWMGKASWFRDNPYTPTAYRMEDFDLLFKTYRHSKFACITEPLVGYRESFLSVKKCLTARKNKVKTLFRHGDLGQLPKALLGQVVMAAADTIAISTGLNYRILKHRARDIEPSVAAHWNDVYSELVADKAIPAAYAKGAQP